MSKTLLRSTLLASALVASGALFGSNAFAEPYTLNSTGTFSNIQGGTSLGSSEFEWGGTFNRSNNYQNNGSTMTADPLSGLSGTVGSSSSQEIGELTWYNASTESGNTPTTVTSNYNLALDFTSPLPGGTANDPLNLSITNTANNAQVCFFIFCSNTGNVNDTTGIGGGDTSITVDGLVLSDFTFVADGGSTFNSSTDVWSNPESNSADLKIYAKITAVPEPASLALLGSALFGFGLIRRRRRH